ncbi:MAG TPA: protease pro-enzyme activation domain-containing protein [Acidobacteriaceae bacterium]
MHRFPRLLLGLLLVSVPLCAQQPRIADAINPNALATLRGSVNPRLAHASNLGPLDPATPMNGVTLYFQPSAAQKAELDALVQAQQTPGSPVYHAWITPAEYGARFGLGDADLAQVEAWLNSQGFNVDSVPASRNSISVSGTAAQVEAAFGTQLNRYRFDGETHFANATDLQIPAALSGILQAVGNLNDFRPRPQIHVPVQPQFTAGSTPHAHYMTPGDVATIYDINSAYNSGYTGSGQTIVVVGQSEIVNTDIEAFQKAAGLTVKDPNRIQVPSSGTAAVASGDEAESDLDVEYAGAIAPGATIDFVYTGNSTTMNVYNSLQYAVQNRLGSVISMSYGTCETELGTSNFSSLESVLEEGASQGQSILAASGDAGSTACYDLGGTGGSSSLTTAQQEALAVNYPASSVYATGIGGTEFPSADVGTSSSQYWQSSSGSDIVSSALSYIPEQVWNDDSNQYGAQYALSSGGGGASAFAARPSWQTGVPGIASGSHRLVPDVSLDASADNAGYLYCTSDATSWSGGQKASCNSGFRDSSTKDLTIGGGTSFATPIFAGLLAIVNQRENASGLGLVNPTLYTLAANPSTYASAFHDITSGSNKCTAGTSYCSTAGAGSYAATTGYDEASGLGSVDFNNLLNAWPAGSGSTLDGTTTSVTPATTTPASGAKDVITITVASRVIATAPTGTVTITVDGTVQTPTLTLSAGTATYTFSSTTAGSHVVLASYSGDATFAASSGSVALSIPGAASAGTFILSAPSVTVSQGSSGTSAVSVKSENSFAGTVSFGVSTTDASLQQYGCVTIGNATVAANGTATSTLTLYTSQSACKTVTGPTGNVHSFALRGGNSAASQHQPPLGRTIPLGAAAFAGLLFLGFRRVRRHAWMLMSCFLLVAVVGLATGCSSSSSAVSTSTDVPKGTYTLTLIGTDTASSSITASTNFTLTVH